MYLTQRLREAAYLIKTKQDLPKHVDLGETCWQAANALDASFEETKDVLDQNIAECETKILLTKTARLANALSNVLPHAQAYADIPHDLGGPLEYLRVPDPERNGEKTLDEILEAQEILSAIGVIHAPKAESLGMQQYPESIFLEEDELEEISKTEDDGSIESALRMAENALRKRNAHQIAGIPTENEEYETALMLLLMRLKARFDPLSPV